MNSDFIAGEPIDKTTALVMSKGDIYVPVKRKYLRYCSVQRPPKRKLKTVQEKMLYNKWRGYKYAKMTVIGISKHSTRAGASWIVQCDCGLFELRKLKAIKNSDNIFDRCMYCEQIARDKRRYDVRRGQEKDLHEY